MRWALLIVVLMSAGCGVSLRSSIDAWHPSGRVSQLDEEDRALLARMVVDTPTDDAMDAREHIDELGEVGDDDVRALLSSSLAWLELVASSRLEQLRDDRCDATRRLATEPVTPHGDIIGRLSAETWVVEGVSVPALRIEQHMGLGILWDRVDFRDAECARSYRALRAVAIARAWLGAQVDDAGVLDVFRVAVERITGSSSSVGVGDDREIAVAIAQHFHQLDPRPWPESDELDRAPSVITLGGAHRGPRHSALTRAEPWTESADVLDPSDVIGALAGTAYDFEIDRSHAVRPGELAYMAEVAWGATYAWVTVARRRAEWRVVEAAYMGQACIENYRRG